MDVPPGHTVFSWTGGASSTSQQTIGGFVGQLAAKQSTPGGGAAAAVGAAVGAAAACMAAEYSQRKKDVDSGAAAKAVELISKLATVPCLLAADEDAQAYADLQRSWKDKDMSAAEKSAIEARALAAPVQMVERCHGYIMAVQAFLPQCNPTITSDAKVGIHMLAGAARSAYQTALVNSPPPEVKSKLVALLKEVRAVEDAIIDGGSPTAAAGATGKAAKGPAQQAKQTPEEKAATQAAKDAEKLKAKIIKEGGKKGVEIEGASDMGGLDFFCTTMELPDGQIDFLELSMVAMNAEPDPEAEDRKGCSGHIGKMIYSAGIEQLAMVAYVPASEHNKSADKVDVTAWMEAVCSKVGATITKKAFDVVSMIPDPKNGSLDSGTKGKITGKIVCAVAKSDPEKGKFALKDKDAAMAAAFAFLRSKGAFPEDNDDDSDDMIVRATIGGRPKTSPLCLAAICPSSDYIGCPSFAIASLEMTTTSTTTHDACMHKPS